MKQAILITAYKNIHHLSRIINHFDDTFSFYIHIDKKSTVTETEIQQLTSTSKKVFISREFVTNWGGVNHLKCSLLLLKEALKNKETVYFHLISGHDYPIQTPAFFHDFLTQQCGKQFIEHFTLPNKIWVNGGMDRLELYNLYDVINAKGIFRFMIGRFNQLQKLIGFKRKLKFNDFVLHGGGTWWTLSRECCTYVDTFIETNPHFLKQFNFTFCAEEIFYHTLILNSPFKNSVVNNSLRYIDWEYKNGNAPANLDETDLDALKQSKQLFARRFEYPVSQNLLEVLTTS